MYVSLISAGYALRQALDGDPLIDLIVTPSSVSSSKYRVTPQLDAVCRKSQANIRVGLFTTSLGRKDERAESGYGWYYCTLHEMWIDGALSIMVWGGRSASVANGQSFVYFILSLWGLGFTLVVLEKSIWSTPRDYHYLTSPYYMAQGTLNNGRYSWHYVTEELFNFRLAIYSMKFLWDNELINCYK